MLKNVEASEKCMASEKYVRSNTSITSDLYCICNIAKRSEATHYIYAVVIAKTEEGDGVSVINDSWKSKHEEKCP